MLTKRRITPIICLAAFFLFPRILSASIDSEKVSLEERFSARVESALSKLIDQKDFIVIVTVVLSEEKTTVIDQKTGKRVITLPGVPERREIGKKEDVDNTEEVLVKYNIKNIFVTLTLDKGIPEDKISEIKDLSIKLLGLNFKRGDTIDIARTDMYVKKVDVTPKNRVAAPPVPWWKKLMEREDIVWIVPIGIVILILTIFLFGTLGRFLSQVLSILPGLKSRTELVGGGGGGGSQAPGAAAAGGASGFGGAGGESVITFKGAQAGSKHPFSFVNRNNLNNLFLLIKDKNPEQIAAVLHYLEPELSSILLAKLDPKVRTEILLTIPKEKQFSPDEVDAIDREIRQNIDYLIGGMDMLIGIYESSEKETQDQMMQTLSEHRPDVVEKIRQRTISFEDLFRLDKPSLRMVLREIPLRSLAISLKSSPQNMKDMILDTLPEGMSEILKEEIEFSQAVSVTRIDEEQRKIIQLVRRLNDEGRILLKPISGSKPGQQQEGKEETEVKKVGMPYSTPEKTEVPSAAASSPSATTKPDSSAIARMLAERRLKMKKK